ncbi:hypothetical protein [Bifidobacterium bifidum]|nr:hypothetical protein [Bifidobacterium bifidum]
MKTPRYLRARHSLPVESPDILHNGHRYRHVPFLPERRPAATGRIKTDWQLGNIQAAAPMPLTSPGNDDDTGENHQPTLRKNTAEPVEQTLKQNTKTQVDPASLLAIIARKPRIWGESPIRNDFPETVRALLDRMDARTRSNLLDDIRAVAADCGFAATVKAVETVINAGRTVDRAAIGTCAKRILEGAGTEGGQDLKRYDKYMKEAE